MLDIDIDGCERGDLVVVAKARQEKPLISFTLYSSSSSSSVLVINRYLPCFELLRGSKVLVSLQLLHHGYLC